MSSASASASDDDRHTMNMSDSPSPSPPTDGAAMEASTEKVNAWVECLDHATAVLQGAAAAVRLASQGLTFNDADVKAQEAEQRLYQAFLSMSKVIETIKDKPFSRLTWPDMKSLNVHRANHNFSVQRLRGALTDELSASGSLHTYRREMITQSKATARELFTWTRSLNFNPEASSRMLIDPLIRALVGLAPQVKTGTDPENELDEHEIAGEPEHDPELEHLSEDSGTEQRELEVYVMPESGIPRPKTKPVAADPLTKNLSGLGGRADYVLISHTLDDGEGVEDQFKEYITSLPEIPESRIGHQAERRLDDACVTVVEAKRLGRHGKPLIDAMPQAIAESLVLGARLKDESGTDKSVPFIMADGSRWIFGVMGPIISVEGKPIGWVVYHSEVLELPIQEMRRSRSGSCSALEGRVLALLQVLIDALVYWSCIPLDRIINTAIDIVARG